MKTSLKTIRNAVRLAALAGSLMLTARASAQGPSAATTATPPAALAAPVAPDYLFPDLPAQALIYDGERFWIKPIIAIVTDYTAFKQDDASLAQVGKQDDTFDLRAARLGLNLRSKSELGWGFTFTTDYQEQRTRDDATWQIYDLKVDLPVGPVKLTAGKQKEPFVFEMVGLMPQLPTQERILSPFFVTRNTGLLLSDSFAGDRMTWAAGVFNDWLETGEQLDNNASDYVARLTGLPWVTRDNRDYLHLGVGVRHAGSDNGSMRLSGRPASNVADKYLDTGNFLADYANMLSLEAAWSHASFLLLAEHVQAWVDAPESGDPHFSGYYLTASWVVTGESRPYLRTVGYAGGIVPTRRYGAVELVGRYSYVDLTDGSIDGGMLTGWYFGVNWWASAQWKVGVSYGNTDLEQNNLRGNTQMVLFRTQWMY
jgi:phosphate-selective porin OprO and OprP